MINQQLIDYIKQQTRQGVSHDNIKIALRSNGWGDADIDEAFNNLVAPLSGAPSVFANQIFRPKGVKVISILYFLGSLLFLGLGVLAFFGANVITKEIGTSYFGKFFAIGGIIFIALGILGILIGIGLWKYKNWARLIAVFFSLVGIIMAIISIVRGSVESNIFNAAVNGIVGGYLFFSPKVKTAFEPEKGEVPMNKKLLWTFIVLLLLLTGSAAVFGSQVTVTPDKTSIQTSPAISPITNPTPTSTSVDKSKVLSPKESYLIMKAEADSIKSYADLEAYTLKYGSKEQIAKVEANKEKIDTSFGDQMVAAMKFLSPSSKEITIIQETINGNIATLNVQTTKPGLEGTVTLVLENNIWKLELESWKKK